MFDLMTLAAVLLSVAFAAGYIVGTVYAARQDDEEELK